MGEISFCVEEKISKTRHERKQIIPVLDRLPENLTYIEKVCNVPCRPGL